MARTIAHVTLVVTDYDEAIDYFVGKLGFRLVEDSYIASRDKRWVVVSPGRSAGASLLLARATTAEQRKATGNQTGGRVAFFLETDDFWRDYEAMSARGVRFIRKPSHESYGIVAVFEDLYGNRWDLLQQNDENG